MSDGEDDGDTGMQLAASDLYSFSARFGGDEELAPDAEGQLALALVNGLGTTAASMHSLRLGAIGKGSSENYAIARGQ